MMLASKRKLLFIITSLSTGGAEKLLVNLVNNINKDQFTIRLISLSDKNPLAKDIGTSNIQFTALPRRWRYDLQPVQQIRKVIAEDRIEQVVLFDLFSYFFVWLALLKIPQKPKVLISIHSTNPKNFKHFLQSTIYVQLLSGSDRFISVCDSQADYMSKAYRIPRKQFTTIYNGVNVDYFHPSDDGSIRRSIRSSLTIPEDAMVILQVASFAAHKHHENSLAALKILLELKPGVQCYLLFVGQGSKDREQKLRTMSESLMLSGLVRFCGLQRDVRPFYQAADIFTLSSQSIETFSIAALEAMSMGLPCILTNVGGACEMIVEGMNGYIVPPKNPQQLARAWIKSIEKIESFDHEKIRTWVIDHFSLADCIKNYENILK